MINVEKQKEIVNPRQVERCPHDRMKPCMRTGMDIKVQRDALPVSEDKSKSSSLDQVLSRKAEGNFRTFAA